MKQLNIFFSTFILTCFALVPATAYADDDDLKDLDVMMEVIDDIDGIMDVVSEMRGTESAGSGGDMDDDFEVEFDDDESDRDESNEEESDEEESDEEESDEDDRFGDHEDDFVTALTELLNIFANSCDPV